MLPSIRTHFFLSLAVFVVGIGVVVGSALAGVLLVGPHYYMGASLCVLALLIVGAGLLVRLDALHTTQLEGLQQMRNSHALAMRMAVGCAQMAVRPRGDPAIAKAFVEILG